MAALGNRQFYARQKAKHLTLILLASLLLGVSYVRAAVVLYCTGGQSPQQAIILLSN
jgi:hypothetical protein